MQELPNGVKVFNGTSSPLRFWDPGWPEMVEVEVDETLITRSLQTLFARNKGPNFEFVRVTFVGDEAGREAIRRAFQAGANVVIGSMEAALAYQSVVAAVPVQGFTDWMRPDKFFLY